MDARLKSQEGGLDAVREAASGLRLSGACAGVGMVVGCGALATQAFSAPALASGSPAVAGMTPAAAASVALVGAALWLLRSPDAPPRRRHVSAVAATFVTAAAALSLAVGALGSSLRPARETVLWQVVRSAEMGLIAAFCLLGLGTGVLALAFHRQALAQGAAAFAASAAAAGLGASLYQWQLGHPAGTALPATPVLLVLAVGLLRARPGRGLLACVERPGAACMAAQRRLPLAMAVPFALGGLFLLVQQAGVVDMAGGLSLFALANAFALVAAVAWTARRADAWRRASEDALRRSEERFRGTLDSMIEGCQIIGTDWRYLYVNDAAAAHGRRRKDELLGRTMMECYPGIEATPLFAALRRCMETQSAAAFENEFRHADGSSAWFSLSIEPAREGLFVLSLDVTGRKQAERRLHEMRGRLRHLVASSPAVLYSLRVEGKALRGEWVSDNILAAMGYTRAQALEEGWWLPRVHPEDRERVMADAALLFEHGQVGRDYRFLHGDGDYRWVRDEQRLLRDASGRPVEVVGSWSDVTARKRAEQRLIESEEQYRLLFDSNPHPMWVYNEETLAFLAVNDAAVRRYGWSRDEFLAMTIRDIRPAEDVPKLLRVVEDHRRERAQIPLGSSGVWVHVRKDGTRLNVELAASPIVVQGRRAWLTLVSDVTEKRELEARLLQSQKMEAVGQLAGGIAHDFNNLLGVIMGLGDLLTRDLGPDHAATGRLDQITKATERAAGLTRQLLAFSRRQVLQPVVLDLNEVLRDVERMLRRLIGEDVEFVTHLAAGLGHVKADQGQLDQVIVNLVVNARDAMPSGGKLIMETSNAEIDETYARAYPGVQPGRYVLLAVSDTGHGMTPETRARVFEPFFTTKDPGKGTGLGLATVYGIVKQSGGHVSVYSEPGRGTTFKVFLPRVDEALTAPGIPAVIGASRGSETVLVVEDAEGLRSIVAEILESEGYTVLAAPDPLVAIDVAGAHAGPIDCILTDVIMPHMSGRDLAERLRAGNPGLRVVFMSGYADAAIGQHGILDAGTPFIQKPFTSAALRQKVREALDSSPVLRDTRG